MLITSWSIVCSCDICQIFLSVFRLNVSNCFFMLVCCLSVGFESVAVYVGPFTSTNRCLVFFIIIIIIGVQHFFFFIFRSHHFIFKSIDVHKLFDLFYIFMYDYFVVYKYVSFERRRSKQNNGEIINVCSAGWFCDAVSAPNRHDYINAQHVGVLCLSLGESIPLCVESYK